MEAAFYCGSLGQNLDGITEFFNLVGPGNGSKKKSYCQNKYFDSGSRAKIWIL